LAVHSHAQGKGIGQSLVFRSAQAGRQRGAGVQRALVAIGNVASERCFEVNGFRPAAKCDLWVGPPASQATAVPIPPGAHLLPVETLTYRGIWVEHRFDAPAFAAAQQIARADDRNTVGAVIPAGIQHDAEALDFAHINTYQWWEFSA
jgi:hypothetical protein